MISAQDHKRAYGGNKGPNTCGMGAIAPSPYYTPDAKQRVEREIIYLTIAAMAAEGRPFKGVLYFGLMLTDDGPKVLEYNARFGDPEAQAVLPLLRSDLVDIMEAIIDKRLDEVNVEWYDKAAACSIVILTLIVMVISSAMRQKNQQLAMMIKPRTIQEAYYQFRIAIFLCLLDDILYLRDMCILNRYAHSSIKR